MNRKNLKVIILIVFFVGLALFARYNSSRRMEEISNKRMITNGVIYEYKTAYKGQTGYHYRFSSDNATYEGFHQGWKKIPEFIGKTFPVIYDSSTPGNCSMLIYPEDFSAYSIPFPDSLKWVLQYK